MKKLIIAIVCSAVLLALAVLSWTALSQDAWSAAAGDQILTIPACAFNNQVDSYDFFRGFHLIFSSGKGYFYAPVNLPNGSVIKKIILICKDNGGGSITLRLERINQSGTNENIALVLSSGTGTDFRTFSQMLTSKKYVNTWKHSHYLTLYLPGISADGYYFSQAKIVYTPPA